MPSFLSCVGKTKSNPFNKTIRRNIQTNKKTLQHMFADTIPGIDSHLHCAKSVRIRRFFGPNYSAVRLNMEIYSVNLQIQSECGKMRTRKTPNMDTFYAMFCELLRRLEGVIWGIGKL